MEMIRITNRDGTQRVLTWSKVNMEVVKLESDCYDAEGYYQAHKSFDTIVTLNELERLQAYLQDIAVSKKDIGIQIF
jgi:hypothetical protein